MPSSASGSTRTTSMGVKDWLYTTLRAEEKKEKEGQEVEQGLKLKGVWPRIMVQKSPEAKARWARLFNFKEEIEDRLHLLSHSMVPDPSTLECFIDFARFRLHICTPPPQGARLDAQREHRKKHGKLAVEIRSETQWVIHGETVKDLLKIEGTELEQGALARARA